MPKWAGSIQSAAATGKSFAGNDHDGVGVEKHPAHQEENVHAQHEHDPVDVVVLDQSQQRPVEAYQRDEIGKQGTHREQYEDDAGRDRAVARDAENVSPRQRSKAVACEQRLRVISVTVIRQFDGYCPTGRYCAAPPTSTDLWHLPPECRGVWDIAYFALAAAIALRTSLRIWAPLGTSDDQLCSAHSNAGFQAASVASLALSTVLPAIAPSRFQSLFS